MQNSDYQQLLIKYITENQPDKLKYNPTVISVKYKYVYFGMEKHMGHLKILKSKLK